MFARGRHRDLLGAYRCGVVRIHGGVEYQRSPFRHLERAPCDRRRGAIRTQRRKVHRTAHGQTRRSHRPGSDEISATGGVSPRTVDGTTRRGASGLTSFSPSILLGSTFYFGAAARNHRYSWFAFKTSG